MLNLKSSRSRFVVLAALLGVATMMLFSIESCRQQDKELAAKMEEANLIPYRKGEKWGYSDANKKLVIQPKYDYASPFSGGLAGVKLNGKWGYVDKSGREVTPIKYDEADSFSEGSAMVNLNGQWGYIGRDGTEYFEP